MIDYEEYLKKSYKDFEERVLNVQELMNFAAEMETLEGGRTFMEPVQDLSDDPMECVVSRRHDSSMNVWSFLM